MKSCDPKKVAEFDYSGLHEDFARLSKPAQRALVNAGLLTPAKLARRTVAQVLALHGMGPSAAPVLRAALRKRGLRFRG